MRILIIEDEKKIAAFIQKGLIEEHYVVDVAHNGVEGFDLAVAYPYDLIVLDLMIPQIDGFKVCADLRAKKINTPIIMLTAKDNIQDKVRGLDLGADDYITKPFSFEELLARIRSCLRRGKEAAPMEMKIADLTLNPVTHEIHRGGKKIEMTNKEYMLLLYLMRNTGRIVTRTMISEHVWDYHFDSSTNVIDVYIKYLRNKIDQDHPVKLIHTIRGVGYTLKEN